MSGKRAVITGVLGQDGSYLAERLLLQGFEVLGIDCVPLEAINLAIAPHLALLLPKIHYVTSTLIVRQEVQELLQTFGPSEIYHLAARSFVGYDFSDEEAVLQSNLLPIHVLLGAVKECCPTAHFFFAASAEMFGNPPLAPQNEQTPLAPLNFYGIFKTAGFQIVQYYRRQHKLFACSAILFNHESTRRGMAFVTRKIAHTAAKIKLGMSDSLVLGSLDARRDWGYAPDFVDAMIEMLRIDQPQDFVLATGISHSVQDFVEAAFCALDLDWRQYVETSSDFIRPESAVPRIGDPRKAIRLLGLRQSLTLPEIAREMALFDLQQLQSSI